MSIPAPSAPTHPVYDDFEEEFIELWTDINEPYCTTAELDKLQMTHNSVDTYITSFAKLTRKALYHENDPTVLEKFKARLPLELLKKCMHHDNPCNWDAWTKSTHTRQAILTNLNTYQPNKTI